MIVVFLQIGSVISRGDCKSVLVLIKNKNSKVISNTLLISFLKD